MIAATVMAGCPSDGGSPGPPGDGSGRSTTVSTSPPLTAPTLSTRPGGTVAGDTVTLTISDLRLVNSEESDNGLRVFLDSAGPTPEVTVILTGVPSPNRTIRVCPAVELERRIGVPGCVTPAGGEAVKVPHLPNYRGLEIVQVGVVTTGVGANTYALGEIAVTFPAATREVRMRLPPLAAGDGSGRPTTLRMTPTATGSYRANARWTGTAAGTGEIDLTLNTPTSTVSQARGGPGTSLTGNLSPPGEAFVRFRNAGSTTLSNVLLTVQFP